MRYWRDAGLKQKIVDYSAVRGSVTVNVVSLLAALKGYRAIEVICDDAVATSFNDARRLLSFRFVRFLAFL